MENLLLNKSKIDYVFYHLKEMYINEFELITSNIQIIFNSPENIVFNNNIVFQTTDNQINTNNVFFIDDIPVLFPLSQSKTWYTLENGTLIFTHDILKAIFYLLSGFQEYKSPDKDSIGRFPYEKSIQSQLGIIHKPIVNYYFEIICAGLKQYSEYQNIKFTRKQLFPKAALFLTHDVDRTDFYHFYEVALKIEYLLGIRKSPYSKLNTFKIALDSILGFINPIKQGNPFWNFEYITSIEKKYHFKSTYFFLNKDKLHTDSRYSFTDKKIRKLIDYLHNNNCEIGLHSPFLAADSLSKMKVHLEMLKSVSPQPVFGNRQHYLNYCHPNTLLNACSLGFRYDSTLGFAGHDGFRNSFCLPFKLYDFENDRIIDVWEIPLNYMDVTFFAYRKLTYPQMFESVNDMLTEIKRFKGVFTMLWHNCFFDEYRFCGVTKFYEELHALLSFEGLESLNGLDIINRLIKITHQNVYSKND